MCIHLQISGLAQFSPGSAFARGADRHEAGGEKTRERQAVVYDCSGTLHTVAGDAEEVSLVGLWVVRMEIGRVRSAYLDGVANTAIC